MTDLAEIDLVVWKMQSLPVGSATRALFTQAYHACAFSGYLRGETNEEHMADLWRSVVRYARESAS